MHYYHAHAPNQVRCAAASQLETVPFHVGAEQLKRLTRLAVLLGAGMIAIGLLVLATSIKLPGTETRVAGMLLVSFGAMMISVPLYLDARRIQAEQERRAAQNSKRGLAPCAICGTETASFWCTTHTLRLCPDCVPKHHDAARCLYKPLLRPAAAKK